MSRLSSVRYHLMQWTQSALKGIRTLTECCLDIGFAPLCIQCGGQPQGPAQGLRFVCCACQDGVYWIHEPACLRCGVPFWGQGVDAHTCPSCKVAEPAFDKGCSVFLHRGLGRRLVHALKYEKALYLLGDIGRLLQTQPYYKRLARFLQDAVLVPVPLHPCKVRERGFNQSQLIAQECALRLPAQSVACLLQRHRLTASQTTLPRLQRLQNVRGAFSLTSNRKPLCPQTRYVLVDDVFTTGATLDACARVLKKNGATRVDVFTLSHG